MSKLLVIAYWLYLQADPQKLLIRKWELQSIRMGNSTITFQELKAKKAGVQMIFTENGKCIVIPQSAKALPQENRWSLWQENEQWILEIEAINDFGRKIKQNLKVEKINKKELILSLGEKDDKEIYTYKASK